MNRTSVAQQTNIENSLAPTRSVLQRKCACGNKTVASGECIECAKKKSGLQRKLAIGASNDPLEREADRVADQVMAMSTNSSIGTPPPHIQRFTGQSTGGTDAAPTSVDRVLSSTGRPLNPTLQQDMGQRFGSDFSQVRVHTGSSAEQSTRDVNAHAYTAGHHVVFGAGQFEPGTYKGRQLLAHELMHVVQQRGADKIRVGKNNNERNLSSIVPGKTVNVSQASVNVQRQGSHRERMVVNLARRRLTLLERYEAQWQTREAHRLRIRRERDQQLNERTALDSAAVASGADLTEPGAREESERNLITQLNRLPLTFSVSEDAIIFRVRFHIRFEDPAMVSRYDELITALQQGIDLIWNQALTGDVFSGRRMQVVAENTAVGHDAPRNQNYWLITVRPTDNEPISYPGCNMPQNDSGVPTSATDVTCDGGVMSIPPHHITMGGVLGHELLHLLGLVDRYTNIVSIRPDGTRINVNAPNRETPGRLDPLGAEDGPVLREDLAFLFEHLGVYEMEANRAFDVLARLEAEGLSIGRIRQEMLRLREVILLGYDPSSLIRPRRDFNDRLIRSVEDI